MTTLFITHDLSTVYYLGGQVMVINKGEIVERGPVTEVMHTPTHPYTRLLLDSIPQPDPDARWTTRITIDESTATPPTDTATEATPII
jgi:peptide/nickel transport system ATP-binding protein